MHFVVFFIIVYREDQSMIAGRPFFFFFVDTARFPTFHWAHPHNDNRINLQHRGLDRRRNSKVQWIIVLHPALNLFSRTDCATASGSHRGQSLIGGLLSSSCTMGTPPPSLIRLQHLSPTVQFTRTPEYIIFFVFFTLSLWVRQERVHGYKMITIQMM